MRDSAEQFFEEIIENFISKYKENYELRDPSSVKPK